MENYKNTLWSYLKTLFIFSHHKIMRIMGTKKMGTNGMGTNGMGTNGMGTKKMGGKWSIKYKKSINCNRPKGFSQKQHCKYGRKTYKK